MVVKACKKDLIVMKNIESDYIEDAYFIMKKEPPAGASADIVKEANLLIHEYESKLKKRRRKFSLPSFFFGVGFSAAVFLILYLL